MGRQTNTEFVKGILSKTESLEPLIQRERSLLAAGSNSIALKDGHHQVLLITDHTNAKNIEAFLEKVSEYLAQDSTREVPACIVLPKLVGAHQSLEALIDPQNPDGVKKRLKHTTKNLKSSIWENNVIYELDQFDGSLEAFQDIRYKEETIPQVITALCQAVDFIHSLGMTHNDLALRNILFKGSYPKFSFGLTDFGSTSYNLVEKDGQIDAKKHNRKKQKDLHMINRIEDKLKLMLAAKALSPEKNYLHLAKKLKAE